MEEMNREEIQALEQLDTIEESTELVTLPEDSETSNAAGIALVVGGLVALGAGAYFGGKKLVNWYKNKKAAKGEEVEVVVVEDETEQEDNVINLHDED